MNGGGSVQTGYAELKALQARAHASAITKQIFGSDWFAHYKFFGQQQTDWMDEQLHFRFWKDKVPAGFKVTLFVVVDAFILAGLYLGITAIF